MSLYVSQIGNRHEACLYVGGCGESGRISDAGIDSVNVVAVQADGDELERIVNQINNIPFSKTARVQIWRGDLAKFIVDNVKL